MSNPIEELDRMEREAWEDDLDLRRQALTDPYIAQLCEQADAEYLAKHGKPWVNPLCPS